ncbi:hypothetical protein Salat_3000000 [Sesamum alatum]|uniref:Uncharacterized protein n=1 Tax=Sesamum alatum TaxID=300844 RepID=A0AAE1XHF2_9LAMI|nr:hypothetical protein Salat_3000000 [Sesamum alatum]
MPLPNELPAALGPLFRVPCRSHISLDKDQSCLIVVRKLSLPADFSLDQLVVYGCRLQDASQGTAGALGSSIGGGDNLPVFLNILFKQVTLEKKIEAALVDDGIRGKGSLRKGMPSAASFSIREELLLRSGR